MPFRFIGQVIEINDPQSGRVEVAIASGNAYRNEVGAGDRVIYLTKYRSGQIGERSIGMSPEVARQMAKLLTVAADTSEDVPTVRRFAG